MPSLPYRHRAPVQHASACLVAALGASLLAFALLPADAWAAKPDATLTADRDAAAAAGNPGLALAYDDVISGVNEFHTPAKRAELSRNRHDDFTDFVVSEVDKLGPLTDENAEATFGLLLALISEARRGDERRVADLAPVIPETLQPLMEAAAARMWVKVEALLAGHEYVRAVQLGDAVAAVAAGDGRYVTRLSEARAEAAEHYASLARSEPAGAPGARLVDARMAALFGGPGPETLTAESAAVAGLADVSWDLEVAGTCGDLTSRLTTAYTSRPGQPTRLAVRFDRCGLEPHASTTHESVDYIVIEHHTETREVYHPGEECVDVEVYVGSDCVDSTSVNDGTTTTCTPDYMTEHNCTDTSYTTQEPFDVAEEHTYTEQYDVEHRDATASTSGSFRVDWEAGTREVPFELAAGSGDDRQYTSQHAGSRRFDYGSETAAYANLAASLSSAIGRTRTEVQAARAALVVQQAQVAVSAGRDAEAGHLFWVAARQTGAVDPGFLTWGQAHYAVPVEIFDAALAGRPLLGRTFEAARVELPQVDQAHVGAAQTKAWEGDKRWEMRQRIMATAGVGVSTARLPSGDGWQVNGPLIQGAATVFTSEKETSWALLARLAYGNNFSGSRISEGDVGVGVALNVVGVSLMPFVGLGYGNMVGILPVPAAAQAEYGLRLGLVLPRATPVSTDLTYTKTGRGSGVVPEEERLDFRVVYAPMSFTFRYSQYLSPKDKIYQFFSGDTRVGSAMWFVGGVGF